jgi:anaerobic dimethyl sulfoxide reductase subunit B (iron-sulfur subunit)
MVEYALLIDYEYCTGCQACEIACKAEHDFPMGKWGIRVLEDGPWALDGSGDKDSREWNWNKIPVPSRLCDLCAQRVQAGKKPSCVHHCLADVMRFGTVQEMAALMAEKPFQVMFVPKA